MVMALAPKRWEVAASRTTARSSPSDAEVLALNFSVRGGKMLDRDSHELGQGAYAELSFELRTRVGYGFVADMQMLRDDTIGLALSDKCKGL